MVGKDRAAVANTLRLLRLPKEVRAEMASERPLDGTCPRARSLSPATRRLQRRAAREVIARGLSVRETESPCKQPRSRRPRPRPRSPPTKDPHLRAAEERLEERWHTRVEIRQHGRKGQIVLHFDTAEELDRLFEELIGDQ